MNYTTPSGFRDVLADEALAREQMQRRIQDLFASKGYLPIETPTLERMDAMSASGRLPETPFKFFDATGTLVTMRPDVTIQVARMCATRLRDGEGPFRFRYTQRVFRDTEGKMRADVREKTQVGVELIGENSSTADAEIVGLFIEALRAAGLRAFTVSLAPVGVLRALVAASGASDVWQTAVLVSFHASNFVEIDRLTSEKVVNNEPALNADIAAAINRLSRVYGNAEAIAEAREIAAPFGCDDALDRFEEVYALLEQQGLDDCITVDFSVMSSFDYYTGIVFEAYAPGMGEPLGSGGRYDNMLAAFGTARPAAGFGFDLESLLACTGAAAFETAPLRIAVPKGSLAADSIAALAAAGLDTTGLDNPGRALIIRNPGVEYIIVRPSDAPVFVEAGAADCGICGEDSLIECAADVVELADLRFGSCRFVVAQLNGAQDQVDEHYRTVGSLRVATKYPRIAQAHFDRRGVQVEIVELRGNIELGPLTGMSECIVDITATGTTLRENNLTITDEVLASTARFFANKASFRTDWRVTKIATKLFDWAADRDLKVTAGGAVSMQSEGK